MKFQILIWLVLLIGLIVIPIVPPLLVLRGQRFWAPWTMLGGMGLLVLTLGSYIGGQFYLGKRMQEISMARKGGPVSESPEWDRVMDLMELAAMVGSSFLVLSFVVYATGILGVALRWRSVSGRAKELEARTAELANLRETGPGGT